MTGVIVLGAVLGVGMVLVIYGTVRENRWGINVERFKCPRCKQPQPQVRNPSSMSEALWGGVTCEHCGCQMDKWGREIVTS